MDVSFCVWNTHFSKYLLEKFNSASYMGRKPLLVPCALLDALGEYVGMVRISIVNGCKGRKFRSQAWEKQLARLLQGQKVSVPRQCQKRKKNSLCTRFEQHCCNRVEVVFINSNVTLWYGRQVRKEKRGSKTSSEE